ncbi:MAG: hypothetical protein ACM3ZQ_06030, partial [Bacillota bacterium]
NTVGLVTAAATAGAIGAHAVGTAISGRLKHNLLGEPTGEQASSEYDKTKSAHGTKHHHPTKRGVKPKRGLWKRLFGGRRSRAKTHEGDEPHHE